MPVSELRNSKNTRLVLILVISLVSGLLILGFLIWCLTQNSKRKRGVETNDEDIEIPMFNLITITTATENFSLTNIIGEGGFGIVYKGTLSTGLEVAVKRLSKNSGQEIVSGRKNRTFHHPDHHHNLAGHAWLLWNEGRATELMDDIYEQSFVESEVLKCIHIGLLCVQKLPEDRPTMASVVVMLSNEGVTLPQPEEPGFFMERSCTGTDMSKSEERYLTHNVVTVTTLEAR
ncbi:unnamed protein product [Fraxinus pennsylvanica]|uniref:S-locus receptor kinase C-terminal domain-containing protein n=1 Tax=Fraxinus pennsylvanica TaxID=56036 RepID=A0AAD2E290_9LAMI|nr:unnamed protein product [Fraxinus pennsylvanica]